MRQGRIHLHRKDHLYIAGFGIAEHNITKKNEDLSFLHQSEKAWYDALSHEHNKKDYLLGRIAAKKAIEQLLPGVTASDIFIDRGVFDFPVVKGTFLEKIQVSISHCNNTGIAIAYPEDHPVGLDLEQTEKSKTGALIRILTPMEVKRVTESSLSFHQYGTMIWTIKESLSKIFRTGLTLDFKLLELEDLTKTKRSYLSSFQNFPQYKGISYCFGEYICSIVLPKNSVADMDVFFDALEGLVALDPRV